jgi:hypothetical protein
MPAPIEPGDCVKLPDGRIARVRKHKDGNGQDGAAHRCTPLVNCGLAYSHYIVPTLPAYLPALWYFWVYF